jgi:hypothetical protein
MTTLERFSEPYQPTGGLAAEGVLNQLGRPDTEPLEVLVREAVQNCWDARRPDASRVEVEIGGRTLDAATLGHLREHVLPDPPAQLRLEQCLVEGVRLLHFADFGTTGLGGPTRADAEPGGTTDFVDFVRNIGQPPDKKFGGGSFGYGKAAFYLASRASTIIVDSYCLPENERRLIAYGLGDHYHEGGVPHTGRHWWGVVEEGVPEPLTGAEAAAMADALGLPARGDDDHGTTVAIVAPYLETSAGEGELDLHEALRFIGECVAWNFWPKMTAPDGGTMRFRLREDGDEVPLPNPRTHPRLAPFAEAMDLLRDPEGGIAGDPFTIRKDLRCHRPKRRLGTIAIQQISTSAAADLGGPLTRGAHDMAAGVHHVALMRTAELIVRYEPGPAFAVTGRGYAGVFRCDPELDVVFRNSEPPTHDAWNAKTLPDPTERTFINTTSTRINEELRALTAPAAEIGGAAAAGVPVGRFADDLAALMPGLDGPGARREPQPGNGGAGGAGGGQGNGRGAGGSSGATDSPRILAVDTPELRLDGAGEVAIRTAFDLDTAGVQTRLGAVVEVLTMDGGQVENEPPIDGAVPVVSGWTTPAGERLSGATAMAEPGASGGWEVWVAHQPDLMIRVGIDAEAVEG